jgi:uncharacterized protein (DUF427 family)
MSRSEAYDRHPEHLLEFDDALVRARVRVGSEVIAATENGLNLREGKYPAIVYFPREDVRMDRLATSDHHTHCPFKGDASYFDSRGGGSENADTDPAGIEHIAWAYEDPFDQMLAIRGHLAFYTDRVTIEIDSDSD